MNACVYRFYDSDSSLLYVGVTKSFQTRMSNHRTNQPWWLEVKAVTIEFCDSWEDAVAKEVLAISSEAPRYNKREDKQGDPTPEAALRRPKTYQSLPEEELTYLLSLDGDEAIQRAYELYRQGWSMRAILEGTKITPTSAWIVGRFGLHQAVATGRPLPAIPLSPTDLGKDQAKERQVVKMMKRLEPHEVSRLQELQQQSSRYRPQMKSDHPSRVANMQYNAMIKDLRSRGVRVREISEAVGVDESNIRRRLK